MANAPIINEQVLQRGIETVPGTLVPATHRVAFRPGTLSVDTTIDRIRRRYSGSAATSHQSSSGLVHPAISWEEDGFYDSLAVALSQFLAPTLTGSGAGADKTWAFLPSDSAPDNLTRVSLEVGGRDTWPEEEKFAGCVGRSIEIVWSKNGDWRVSLDYMGIRSTQGAKAAALTMPATLVPILGRLTKLYLDPTTFGAGAIATGVSGRIRIEPQLSARFGSDGLDYANRIAVLGRKVSATFIAEYNATVMRTAWRASTVEKVRLEAPGPVLGGSAYNAQFDIAGTFETSQIGDDDGVLTLAHELTAEYNVGLGADISATVVCSLAAPA